GEDGPLGALITRSTRWAGDPRRFGHLVLDGGVRCVSGALLVRVLHSSPVVPAPLNPTRTVRFLGDHHSWWRSAPLPLAGTGIGTGSRGISSSTAPNWVRTSSWYRPPERSSSEWVPRSTIRPRSITAISSACLMVDRRWAMTIEVRPRRT